MQYYGLLSSSFDQWRVDHALEETEACLTIDFYYLIPEIYWWSRNRTGRNENGTKIACVVESLNINGNLHLHSRCSQ